MSDTQYERLWQKICGDGSLLSLMHDTPQLALFVNELVVTVFDDANFEALACFDEETQFPMIALSTGCLEQVVAICQQGVAAIDSSSGCLWAALGFDGSSFASHLEFAEFLSDMVIDFIVLHELGHIARGHLQMLSAAGAAGLFEVGEDEGYVLKGLDRIAIELDADNFAVYMLVSFRRHWIKHLKRYQVFVSEQAFMATLSLAKVILFNLLAERVGLQLGRGEPSQTLKQQHFAASHPHPSIRHEFSDQILLQLADNQAQAEQFLGDSEIGYKLYVQMQQAGIFNVRTMCSWRYDSDKVAAFINQINQQLQWLVDNKGLGDQSLATQFFEQAFLGIAPSPRHEYK